jgi:A/G-specific adenine glycosylase
MPLNTHFAPNLLAWWANNSRDLPWKNTKDPYIIWLSEIILQQTRVEQGLPYFNRFMAVFPTIKHLADATIDQVIYHWEGLGYYSRARNLHQTAQHVSNQLNGIFPNNFDQIKQLKGVGNYTAAAIASFAFDLPHAVVDGNVYRVLARIFGIDTPIDSTQGKQQFAQLAQTLLPTQQAANFNQAIMDFGATCCTPKQPNCHNCPFQSTCHAFQYKKIAQLPVKSKKIVRSKRYFTYCLISDNAQNIWIQQRQNNDIWQSLYEFPMIETQNALPNISQITQSEQWQTWFGNNAATIKNLSESYRQTLTHIDVTAQFCEINVAQLEQCNINNAIMVAQQALSNYAFPKIIKMAIK